MRIMYAQKYTQYTEKIRFFFDKIESLESIKWIIFLFLYKQLHFNLV